MSEFIIIGSFVISTLVGVVIYLAKQSALRSRLTSGRIATSRGKRDVTPVRIDG